MEHKFKNKNFNDYKKEVLEIIKNQKKFYYNFNKSIKIKAQKE